MKRFFHCEKGNADEAWYYLARDAETGAVYVERQWASRDKSGCNRIEIGDFLEGPSTIARNNLLRSIGATIAEASDTPRAQRRRRKRTLH
jgi:hypothetical protein